LLCLVVVVATAPRWWPVLRTTPEALRACRWGTLPRHASLAVVLLALLAQAVSGLPASAATYAARETAEVTHDGSTPPRQFTWSTGSPPH